MDNELFSPEDMQSPFDAIKETDSEGREWWNSRKLARLMGYQKYWNFERLMDKVAAFMQQEKGLDLKEHMAEIQEMDKLNNCGYSQVSTAIKKVLYPSDNCEGLGTIMYNLDVIIAVGYRVNSYEATQLRNYLSV